MVDKISGQVGVQAAGGNKMARRGENIHKRKDGRWEGRYIKARTPEGKIQWGYVYGIVYAEVKRVLIQKKAEAGFYNLKRTDLTFEALAEVWLHSLRNSIKESTCSTRASMWRAFPASFCSVQRFRPLSTSSR